jgi:hypothetical protein
MRVASPAWRYQRTLDAGIPPLQGFFLSTCVLSPLKRPLKHGKRRDRYLTHFTAATAALDLVYGETALHPCAAHCPTDPIFVMRYRFLYLPSPDSSHLGIALIDIVRSDRNTLVQKRS